MAEKEGKNINTALKGVLASDSTLVGLVDGNVRQISVDESGGLMTFDKGVSKSDIGVTVSPLEVNGEVAVGDKRAVSGEEVYSQNYLNKNILDKDVISRNLLDKKAVVNKKLIDYDTGNILDTSDSSRNISDYIPVIGGQVYVASGLSTNVLNQRISFFTNKGDTVATAKMTVLSFTPPSDGFVVIDVMEFFKNTAQLEIGNTPTSYTPYVAVVNNLYGFELLSTYADKTTKYPIELDDIADLQTINNVTYYDIYTDDSELFDLNNALFDKNYSTDTKLGYIRQIEKEGYINRLDFFIAKNSFTDPIINVSICKVDSVGNFTPGTEVVLGNFQINTTELGNVPELKTFMFNNIKVNKNEIIVVLFDSPTVLPVFKTTAVGYDVIYQTVADPTIWRYGYRKSSGINMYYVNENTERFIKEYVKKKDVFEGKKIVTFGDSITAHAGSWARLLFAKYGQDFINLAVSGARFQDYEDTEIDLSGNWNSNNNTAFNQLLRLAQALTPVGEQITITNPYNGAVFSVPTDKGVGLGTFEQPDLIVVAIGTNDSATTTNILDIIATPINDLNRKIDMVHGARWFFEMLRSLCVKAEIIVSTPIQANPTTTRRYAITQVKRDRLVEVSGYYACPVIDSFNESGICEKYEIASSQGKYLYDGLHPDDNGKLLMANFLGNRIEKLINKTNSI